MGETWFSIRIPLSVKIQYLLSRCFSTSFLPACQGQRKALGSGEGGRGVIDFAGVDPHMNSEEHILLNCQCLSLTCGMHSAPYCQPWVLAPNLGRQKINSPITSLAAYLQCEVLLIRLSCVQTALTLVSLRPENSSNYFPQIIPFEATLKSQECIFFGEM